MQRINLLILILIVVAIKSQIWSQSEGLEYGYDYTAFPSERFHKSPELGLSNKPFLSKIKIKDTKIGDKAFSFSEKGFRCEFFPVFDENGNEYKKIIIASDLMSEKKFTKRRGLGIHYFLTPDIHIMTGPAMFKEANVNSKSQWAVLLNVNFALYKK